MADKLGTSSKSFIDQYSSSINPIGACETTYPGYFGLVSGKDYEYTYILLLLIPSEN